MRILLTSNSARVNSEVKAALIGRSDIDFLEVTTPQRALAVLDDGEQGAFDLVLADNDMHPAGGFYLSREIKARAQMGREMPPVILVLARPQDVWLSDWAQADAYVLKPIDPFNLAEVVDAIVAGQPVPALPNVGGDPTPSLLQVPGGSRTVQGSDCPICSPRGRADWRERALRLSATD